MPKKEVLLMSNIKFPLGQTVATRGVQDLFIEKAFVILGIVDQLHLYSY
jgi:hypothetical protein